MYRAESIRKSFEGIDDWREDKETLIDGRPRTRRGIALPICIFLTLVSVTLNLILLLRTDKANLKFDQWTKIDNLSPYGGSNHNDTDRSILWERLETSNAQVALDAVWAANHALPSTQAFTWDVNKSVYSLRGIHAQHCLRILHRWVTISHHGGAQFSKYEHVLHCLDSLLQDIHCFADDTPMRSPAKGEGHHSWGHGQQRRCRSWNRLHEWSQMHNACFVYMNETQGVGSMLDRYKWCPPGSPYRDKVQDALGFPSGEDDFRIPDEIESMPPYWEDFDTSD